MFAKLYEYSLLVKEKLKYFGRAQALKMMINLQSLQCINNGKSLYFTIL